MSSNPIVNRIRIIPREQDFLNRNVGSSGEIFYNREANSLRLYSGKQTGGFEVLSESNLSQTLGKLETAAIKYNVTVGVDVCKGLYLCV